MMTVPRMQLQTSLAFNPGSDGQPRGDESYWDAFPRQRAVFALFLKRPDAPPYLSHTTDLRRRLRRILEARRRPGPTPVESGDENLLPATAVGPGSRSAARDPVAQHSGILNQAVSGSVPSGSAASRTRLLNLREVVSGIAYQVVGSSFEGRWLLYRLNQSYYPESYRQRLRLRPPALLKINLKNRFPRCYPTRKLSSDGSLYYGPFASRVAAERFAAEFLDLFTIRRCVEDLNPDPAHPGCIYSQMHMCLAPCFRGCTDEEYQQELGRVIAFMDSEGHSLIRSLEAERAQASEKLEFEAAAKAHHTVETVQQVMRLKPDLARNLADLNAIILQRGAEPKSVTFFRVISGELCGPATLSLGEKVATPISLDDQIRNVLDSLAPEHASDVRPTSRPRGPESRDSRPLFNLPPWEHLAILARWYYSSFREGEIMVLPSASEVPHTRLIRLCRKLIDASS
jgi:excinuclease ABC subunit C